MASYLPWITGSGGALAVLAILAFLFLTGQLHSSHEVRKLEDENTDLKRALEAERIANNELARAGGVTAKVLDALVEVATDRHEHDRADRQRKARAAAGLTAEDLGLLCDGRGGTRCGQRTARRGPAGVRLTCPASGCTGSAGRSSSRYVPSRKATSSRPSSGHR